MTRECSLTALIIVLLITITKMLKSTTQSISGARTIGMRVTSIPTHGRGTSFFYMSSLSSTVTGGPKLAIHKSNLTELRELAYHKSQTS